MRKRAIRGLLPREHKSRGNRRHPYAYAGNGLLARGRGFQSIATALLLFTLLLALSVSSVFVFPMPALAADGASSGADASGAETVIMGCYPDPGMMNIDAETGEKSGYAYEYAQEIAAHTGWRYSYVYGTFSELMDKLSRGEIDLLPVVSATEERRTQYLFPDYEMADETFYLASLQAFSVGDDLRELNGLRIGSIEGYFQNQVLEAFLEENGLTCTLIFYASSQDKWDAAQRGEIDLTVESSLLIQQIELYPVCEIGENYPIYTAVSPTRPDLLEALNAAQKELEEENPTFLSSLRVKYFKTIPLFKALSEKDNAWLAEHGALRVGVFYIDDPLVYTAEDGEVKGVIPEYIQKMFDAYGLDLPIEWHFYYTNDEALVALRAGEIDVIHPYYASYSVAESEGVILSNVVYKSNMSILYLGDFTDTTMERIATPVTRLGVHYVRDNYPDAEIVPCQSGEDCLEKLLSGEANCVVMNTHGLTKLYESSDKNLHIKTVNSLCNCSFAAMPENAAVIDIINRASAFLTEPDINAIEAKYFAEYTSNMSLGRFLRRNPGYIVALVSVFLVIVLIAVLLKRKSDLAAEKEKSRQELAEALSLAESASRAKTTFLNNMSHDIRTPLNAVIGYTNLAAGHIDNTAQVRDYLSKISQSSTHLLSLINDVLDMSRIESGRMHLDEQPENLLELTNALEEILQADIRANRLDFTLDTAAVSDPYVLCDKLQLNRVLINILSNAIKYTPAGGRVLLRLTQKAKAEDDRGVYEFLVKDNGIGMSEEFLATVFDPFTRAKSSTVSGIQGTGLGMAVTKNIVDMMGGEIHIESEPEKGTEVRLLFTFKLQAPPDEAEAPQEADAASYDFTGKKILLVEDNALNREIATEILEEEGFVIDTAEDGTVAVEKARAAQPGDYDLILMDIQMPLMDGYEAARQIRSLGTEISDIPILAMTANAFEEDRKLALAAGMNEHLAKPIDVEKLKATLKKFL